MTASQIQPAQPMPLAQAQPGEFTREQIDLIKQTVAVGTTDLELKLFLEVCRSTGLNPFLKQVYAIKRKSGREEKMTIQTGIDGYRLIAARSGTHLGTSDAEFGPVKDGYPEWARVIVRRLVHGHVAEFPATARWSEYVQTKDEWVNNQRTGKKVVGDMWARMPHTMLSKCAEGLALRKAFPAELSGIYTDTEMEQADNPSPAAQEPRSAPAQVQQEAKPTPADPEPTEDAESIRRRTYGPKLGARRNALKTYGVTEQQVSEELAKLAPWYAADENAENAVAMLTTWGMRLKAEHEARMSESDTMDAEFTPAEPVTPEQIQQLQGAARSAGASTSEDRAGLWAYMLNTTPPVPTKSLTAEQAVFLLDTFSGMSPDERKQCLAEAKKAAKGQLL